MRLTQDELIVRLREKGLSVAVKQIWGWEKGQHTPTSISKARMDEVLGGNPRLSDDLLVYDQEREAQFVQLEQQAHDFDSSEEARTRAQLQLEELARAAVGHGIAVALHWL
jgi:hypothetical protein